MKEIIISIVIIIVLIILGLTGFLWYQNNQTIKTTSWRTYTNADLNFQFKYPADWTVKSQQTNQGQLVLTLVLKSIKKNESYNLSVDVEKKAAENIVNGWSAPTESCGQFMDANIDCQDILIDQVSGIQIGNNLGIFEKDAKSISAHVMKNRYDYRINLTTDRSNFKIRAIFKAILTNFKFTK